MYFSKRNSKCWFQTKFFISAALILFILINWLHTDIVLETSWNYYHKLHNTSIPKIPSLTLKSNESKCEIPPLTSLDDFFNYPKMKGKMSCTHLAELGGHKRGDPKIYPYNEGARMVCLDHIKRGDCIILSFGIGNDATFDVHASKLLDCQVYMFDPTVIYENSKLPSNMKFSRIGLSNKKANINIDNLDSKVDRYEAILKELNLQNRVIDYLKVDIEASELEFFADLFGSSRHLLDNVRQIGLEIHPCLFEEIESARVLEVFRPFWENMHRFECAGFDLISFIPNLYPESNLIYKNRTEKGCFDIEYLRRTSKKS